MRLFCSIFLALLPCAHADTLPEPLRVPPGSGVLDTAGLFNRDSGALERITGQLAQLRKDHGYRLYLIVEPVFMSGNVGDLAAQLQQEWLPDGNGLVVVFESDSRNLGFGRDPDGKADMPAEAPVPTHVKLRLLEQAVAATDTQLAPGAYAEALTGNLVKGFNNYFMRRNEPPPHKSPLRVVLLTLGGLALLALAAISVGALTRLKTVAGVRTFHFPEKNLPERLGAPCGTRVTTRVFKNQQNT
jgi:hypothetical protein